MMKIARIYERVSASEQDLTRQLSIEKMVTDNDDYIAGVYREKASGASAVYHSLKLKNLLPPLD